MVEKENNIAYPMLLRPVDPSNKSQSADEMNFHENHNYRYLVNLSKKQPFSYFFLFFFLDNYNFEASKTHNELGNFRDPVWGHVPHPDV
jgi:hypothetical protein